MMLERSGNQVALCGAKTRQGSPCKNAAMKNGRCRMHGGASTGPKTVAGLEKSRLANWKHGRYSEQARAARKAHRLFSKYEDRFVYTDFDDCFLDAFEDLDEDGPAQR